MASIEFEKCFTQSDKNMLLDRKTYIGGSDSYSIYSEGKPAPWGTPFTVWCEKSGYKIKKDNIYMQRGRARESSLRKECKMIIEKYFNLPYEVDILESPLTYRLKTHPYIGANIDGFVRHRDTGRISGLEIKTASKEKSWLDFRTPDNYVSQVQHYMLVTGLKEFYIVCECYQDPANPLIIVRLIKEHPLVQEIMIKEYIKFWDMVKNGVIPDLKGSCYETPYLKLIKKRVPEGSSDQISDIQKYYSICKQQTDINKEKEILREKMVEILKDKNAIVAGNYSLSINNYISKTVDHDILKNYPDIYKECLKESSYNRITIREINLI